MSLGIIQLIVEKLNFAAQKSNLYQGYLSDTLENLSALKSAILSKELQCEVT